MKKFFTFKQNQWLLIQLFFMYCWLVNLQNTDAYYSVYLVIGFATSWSMYHIYQSPPDFDNKLKWRIGILSLVLSIAIVMANHSVFYPWTAIQSLFEALCTMIGGMIAFYNIVVYLLTTLPIKVSERSMYGKTVFLTSFILLSTIYLCHLFFRIYPGILTRDSTSTISQILSGEYNNTMPFWHTLTVQVFFNFGMNVFGEINAAIATVHSVQSLFLAGCFAYAVVTLYQLGVPNVVNGMVLIGYAIMPYHIVYSATLWKDVLFGGAALLVVVSLLRIVANIGKYERCNTVIFIMGSVGLCLWRTNGLLAYGMLTLVMLLTLREKYRKLLLIMIIILILCFVLTGPLLSAMNVPETNFVEALAIPFQQVSRVIASDLPLTEMEHQMLSDIFDLNLVREKYDPLTVDPIKFEAMHSSSPLLENPLRYLDLWIKLGLRYPGVYLTAWIEETKGYWNAGYEFWIYTYQMDNNSLGIISSAGTNAISSVFQAAFRYLEKLTILQPLFSIGLQVWITVICCFINKWKRREIFLLSLPGMMIVVGLMIGTPVFAEFRYAYPVFTTVPVILCCTLFSFEEMKES